MVYVPVDVESKVLKECKRRRLSPRTAKSYSFWINRFFDFCKKDLQYISKKDVRFFLEKLSEENKSGSTMNVAHMALRFLFEIVLERRMWIDIKYSKTPKRIQRFLSQEEVKRLIDSTINFKHQLMICLVYSAGLRVGELINLKIKDLELERGYGYVRNGKGGKDRLIVLSNNLIPALKNLISKECLSDDDCLFISNRGKKYSSRSIEKIIKNSARKAKIKNWKEIHPHTLRHSFATHLIEKDSDVSTVQAMLGHKSPETTMIYVHSSSANFLKTRSPLESL